MYVQVIIFSREIFFCPYMFLIESRSFSWGGGGGGVSFFPAAAQLHNCGMGSWVGTGVRACMLFLSVKVVK